MIYTTPQVLFGRRLCSLALGMMFIAAVGCNGKEVGTEDTGLSAPPPPDSAMSEESLTAAPSTMAELPSALATMLATGKFATWIVDKSNADFDKKTGNHGPEAVYLDPEGACSETTSEGHVRAFVASEKRAKKLKKGVIGNHGAVLAKITNPTNCTTKGFVLTPKQTLYWIAVPDARADSGMIFHFVEEGRDVRTGKMRACGGRNHPGNHTTSKAHMVGGDEGTDVCAYKQTVDTKHLGFVKHNSRPWVTCEWGCCVSTGEQMLQAGGKAG